MNYEFRLAQTGIKRIYYYGNPIFGSLQSALLPTFVLVLIYKYILIKYIQFFQGKQSMFIIVSAITYLVSFLLLYRKKKYIQWDERNIRFKNINGYTAIVGVDKIKSIKIERGKGIYVTHDNFIDETRNGTYLIPFENLGRNYNIDVDIITEDFKKLYPNLILEDKEL
ncbi:hypothetical protein [Patiriisocius marinus]|nr:hypothetical protein [Patiriisocius marinus]